MGLIYYGAPASYVLSLQKRLGADDCLLVGVTKRAVPGGYRPQLFEYARSAQILCLPRERLSLLARLRGRGRMDCSAVLKGSP